ncbi:MULTISPECIES: hypothetical protein [unclassified Rhizobium]|uniref:acyl-CoA-like ligand-binding transcription factor n=1 Tax=unclassified Rhizobium TaxID=2613769 RepID=UPI000A20F740|nr:MULTISPECIES: hypothetical protein [unclassified Rhizobium]ARO24655.1 TetR family transcriptional regulator protein [Rhizobium sp. TAL182]
MHADAQFCAQVLVRDDCFGRVHMDRFHEPARRISADSKKRDVRSAKAISDPGKVRRIASIAAEIDAASSNQTKYLQMEQATFEVLCEIWPQAERRRALRVVAMVSVGALRLAIDRWAEEQGQKSLSDYVREAFADLKAELANA